MTVAEIIPIGREYAMSRAALREVTGLDDREMRRAIAKARREGIVIINLQNGDGYFRPSIDDEAELIRWTLQEDKRIRTAAIGLNAAKKKLKEMGISIVKGAVIRGTEQD